MSAFDSPTIEEAASVEIEPPSFVKFSSSVPSTSLSNMIDDLQLVEHKEGGFFKETDRSPFTMEIAEIETDSSTVPNARAVKNQIPEARNTARRNYSTLIYYLLTPASPIGRMHKNKSRIIHILQRGRGQYILVYPSGKIKSFKVGFNYSQGEISQWVVPGGVYKASFVLPNDEFFNALLISEVVVPGFEYTDHDFISGREELELLVGADKAEELGFLI